MSSHLVSVIIPTFNRSNSVRLAIESVLVQSHDNFELIVVDDGSTDDTLDCLYSIEDNRIKIIHQQHRGVSSARNNGVGKSSGQLIAFLDSDDIWQKEKLSQQLEFHESNPDYLISQTQEIWIRNKKRVNPRDKHRKPEGYIFPYSLHLCTITPSSVLMKRQLFEDNGGFDEDLPACEDYDLWLKISAKHKVGLIDELLLTKYGGHEDQLSQKFPAMDRFRIYSLGKLICSQALNNEQCILAVDVLRKKLDILIAGAEKRRQSVKKIKDLKEQILTFNLPHDDFVQLGKSVLLSDGYIS